MRRWLLFFLVMLFYMCVNVVWAQESGQVVIPLSEEYIREWLVIGSFFPDDLERDFLADAGGEENIEPREGDIITTSDGKTLTWKRYESSKKGIQMFDALGYSKNSTAYAFCTLRLNFAGNYQIRVGSEDGVAVWINGKRVIYSPNIRTFSFDQDLANVNLKAGLNRCLVKIPRGTGPWYFTVRFFPPARAEISGNITDDEGVPANQANVRLKRNGEEITRTKTDASGSYHLGIYPAQGTYDLSVTSETSGDWRLGISLGEGERQKLDLVLREAVSIQGKLVMLDDKTPHVAVPVQVVQSGKLIATKLSDGSGKYRFINLKPGRYQVRCQILDGYVYYRLPSEDGDLDGRVEGKESVAEENGDILVKPGSPVSNIDFRLSSFKKGAWRSYNVFDGLADNYVYTIHQDSDGVMWFGTAGGGVSRYDGKEFINLTTKDGLADDWVFAIHQDPDGVMWFGTMVGGVSRYDGKEFVNLTTEDGLISDWIRSIYRDSDGIMWFGTREGASRYDGSEFVSYTVEDGLVNNSVRDIYKDPNGFVWFATNGGISRYDGETFVNFTKEDGLASDHIRSIHRDPDGVMWFGTLGRGIASRYDGKGFVNLTSKDVMGIDWIKARAVYHDADGVMWFATNKGVFRYSGGTFVCFTKEDGLVNNSIHSIYRDRDGAMWFGTENGVSRYDEESLVSFTIKDGLGSNNVQASCYTPDGIAWFATRAGVSRYDGVSFQNFKAEDGLADNVTRAVYCDADGILWFASSNESGGGLSSLGGVSRYDGESFLNLTPKEGLAWGYVSSIYSDQDNVVWFGTQRGISRYDGLTFANFTKEDGLTNANILSIHQDPDGIMWFGTGGGGVSRYDGKEFVNFTTEDGLADDWVLAIHQDPDGVMWFGTAGGGVSRYNGKEFINLATEDGLADDIVMCIERDVDEVMWLGTSIGASRYDGVAWASLDTRDGLPGNNVRSIYQDADGFLWFATDGGITRYRPTTSRPGVHITHVRTVGKLYTDLTSIPPLAVGKYATIGYSAVDLKTIPEKRQYRYRISEVDSEWGRPTKATEFEWIPQKPGTYTFEVQAIDRDLNYSEPASVEIEITPPPFYTRAWFIVGAILAAFFIPTAAYAIILTKQKKQDFQPLANPYIVGNPIRSKEMFFGRRSDFEFIRIKLGAGKAGLVVVFAGERRSGKTSILFQILNGELGERIVPVMLDMQAMTVDSEVEFLGKIASEISEALVRVSLKPPTVDFEEGSPVRVFEGFISEVMETLEGKELLLLIDEYELIESKIDDGVLRPDIITFFASLLEAHPRLSFIFTGSRHLELRNPDYWRILIGKSLYRHISFLSPRDAVRLITEPAKGSVIYPAGIPESIIRLTAGQPFYTQVVCQNLIDRLNEVERNRVRQEDVDVVAQELSDNPLPQMIYFWDDLESDQQSALSLLGEVIEDSSRYASARMLLDFASEQKLTFLLELSVLERTLDDLFVHEVLERERAGEGKYEYRFRVDLFRIWARQAHSVWQSA